jgi:hypothetical protein
LGIEFPWEIIMQIVKNTILTAIFAGTFFMSSAIGKEVGSMFTLSDEDLMSLDVYFGSNPKYDPNVPKIVAQRDVSGPGVEFDIYFPTDNKNKSNYVLTYVSCDNHGKGTLVGIDVNDFDAFALKFTLIAVDGKNDPNVGSPLIVGALVNAGYTHSICPEYISLAKKNEVVSIVKTDAEKTSIIGFIIYKSSPDGWSPQGNTVTIRIEAAPNAQIP